MVSAVLAEDSSSASANSLAIRHIERASVGILKVYPAEGPFFYVREGYCSAECLDFLGRCESTIGSLGPDETVSEQGVPAADDVAQGLFFAARAWLAERAAMGYLARAEYCRKQLEDRLARKGFSQDEAASALSFLESERKLDDSRYAAAWLRARLIHQSEGRRKLLAGLRAHGVSNAVAERALGEFFVDTDERELCEKAAKKLVRLGKTGEKLYAALIRKGFSGKIAGEMAKKTQEAHENR
jgi:regulatory protein